MCYYTMALDVYALLAQLDRAFGYGPKGQEFESLTARQKRKHLLSTRQKVFSFQRNKSLTGFVKYASRVKYCFAM